MIISRRNWTKEVPFLNLERKKESKKVVNKILYTVMVRRENGRKAKKKKGVSVGSYGGVRVTSAAGDNHQPMRNRAVLPLSCLSSPSFLPFYILFISLPLNGIFLTLSLQFRLIFFCGCCCSSSVCLLLLHCFLSLTSNYTNAVDQVIFN